MLMFPLAFAVVALLWEGYKAVGPEKGGEIGGVRVLARTGDRAMPHIWDMLSRFTDPEVRGGSETIFAVVLKATWYSFRVAFAAFVIGALLGILLAVLLLGVFLAFFPVAVGALRGLQSTNASSLELMDSFAAGWWRTLWKLRFPSAVPYIAPALRLAGAAAVVGVVVSEISLGLRFGVGRLILSYGQEASSDPPKLLTAVFGAAALGLVMAAVVFGFDRMMMRNRPPEAA